MEIKISTAAPYLTFPEPGNEQFKYDKPKDNHDLYEHQHRVGQHSTIFGYDAYTTYDGIKFGSITLVKDGWVMFNVYFSTKLVDKGLHIEELESKRFVEILQVWQDEHYKGLARKILDYMLSQTDVILTSEEQWPNGKRMWKTFVTQNFDKYHFYHNCEKSLKLVNLNNLDDLWSKTDESFRKIRIVVSKVKL